MKLTTFLAILLAMVSAFSLFAWKQLHFDIEEELSSIATGINENAPIQLDAHTDMIGARLDGKEITYLHRVYGLSKTTMAENKDFLRGDKLARAQNNQDITRLLQSGATITYEYFVGDDLALSFSIDHNDHAGKG